MDVRTALHTVFIGKNIPRNHVRENNFDLRGNCPSATLGSGASGVEAIVGGWDPVRAQRNETWGPSAGVSEQLSVDPRRFGHARADYAGGGLDFQGVLVLRSGMGDA